MKALSAVQVDTREWRMLWDASAINGYVVEASDGGLGTVSDLLFEDVGWVVRWLVVDIGNWLPGRKVLLPLSALGRPDRVLRRFSVKLTMQQIRESPDLDANQPVSRQHEANLYDYYGWDPYWVGGFLPMNNVMATPFAAPLHLPNSKPRDVDEADATPNERNPHLRSVAVVTGYNIHATDGGIGHVEDFPRGRCRMEPPLHQGRYQERVARREGPDCAEFCVRD